MSLHPRRDIGKELYWGLRSYNTPPQIWGGREDCDHSLSEAPGKVLTGGTGEASAKQLTNAGSQYGNGFVTVHPAGYRTSDTHPGRLQHAGNTGRDRLAGAVCQRCGAFYGELGSEPTPQMFVEHLVEVFRALWRVLRDDGTVWCNISDSYIAGKGLAGGPNGHAASADPKQPARRFGLRPQDVRVPGLKPKDLALVPQRLAIALQEDGWYIRSQIAWCKLSAMPESVQDRPTNAWEPIWMLAKSRRYFYDPDAVRQPHAPHTLEAYGGLAGGKVGQQDARGKVASGNWGAWAADKPRIPDPAGANLRNYWVLGPEPLRAIDGTDHYAAYPTEIARRAILAGTSAVGCCAACGSPRRRVTETSYRQGYRTGHLGFKARGNMNGMKDMSHYPALDKHVETMGWAPTCDHADAPVVPATVLDIFAGSFTTVLVADRLGRHGIGIELSAAYVAMGRRRLEADAPMVAAVEQATATQTSLFEAEGA